MNACIITIGNEILDGTRLDTNSQWISLKIIKHGIITDKIISIADNKTVISKEIKNSIDKYNFLIWWLKKFNPIAGYNLRIRDINRDRETRSFR